MDFIDRLQDRINSIAGLPFECLTDYLDAEPGLRVYSLSGGQVVQQYMDGSKEEAINFEIAIRDSNSAEIEHALWIIQSELENLHAGEIQSDDGSFEFNGLTITNKPFLNNEDEKGLFTYMLDVQANITTEEQ